MTRASARARAARLTIWLTAPAVLAACGEPDNGRAGRDTLAGTDTGAIPAARASGAACPAGAAYTIRDTSDWATMIEEGKRAVLRAGPTVIDTVDVTFGVHVVGRDSLVFLPVLAYEVDTAEAAMMTAPAAWPTDHVLCSPTARRMLSEIVPYFNAGFSSPAVIDSAVYYWGLKPQNEQGRYRLYAMRYTPRRNHLDSLFLREEAPATDYRYFYGPPFRDGRSIIFDGGEMRALIDPATWRVVRLEPRAPPDTARA